MIEEICEVLSECDISFCGPYERNRKRNGSHYTTYQIDINGINNFEKWMDQIGFRNQKHLKKISEGRKRLLPSESPLPDSNRGFGASV